MKTIIAEKPSVAREIARIVGATKREEGYFEGGGYAVTWAFGHLVQLAMPDGYGVRGFVRDNLPIIPDTFTLVPRQVRTEKGYKPDSGVVSQIKVIKRLFDTSEHIIVATDAGREGELIFRYLYHYTGCTTPFVRLWISSLTDKAIREGLRKLEDGSKYDNLYLAAKARSESDWLVGINGTQALSIAAGHGTYSVGRVQTPTLAMVCERYWENRRFTSEAFWQLHIATDGCDGEVVKFSSSEKWKEKEPAMELYNKVKAAGCATVTKAERKEKTEETPLLYDLTTLQKEANAKHGFTAEQTLEIAQKLYEKKLITYPRTGSRGDEGLWHRYSRHTRLHHRNAFQARLHGTLQEVACVVKTMRIADVAMTGEWEKELARIERGELSDDTFRKEIEAYTREITSELGRCRRVRGFHAAAQPQCGCDGFREGSAHGTILRHLYPDQKMRTCGFEKIEKTVQQLFRLGGVQHSVR